MERTRTKPPAISTPLARTLSHLKQMPPPTVGPGRRAAYRLCQSPAYRRGPDTAPLSQACLTGIAPGSGLENKHSTLVFFGCIPGGGARRRAPEDRFAALLRGKARLPDGEDWRQVVRATCGGEPGSACLPQLPAGYLRVHPTHGLLPQRGWHFQGNPAPWPASRQTLSSVCKLPSFPPHCSQWKETLVGIFVRAAVY